MTYPQTLDYLFARLPMYQRVGAAAYKADLSNTIRIAEHLGKPHLRLKCIHVAGTNGKGSSSHMLAAILQKCGYKTGLYTSPHLTDFRERIRINGKMIPKKYVVDFVARHKEAFEQISPSFFEWSVGLMFDYFASEEVDVAVIETGLGGRLDSTNIILPQACLITNIGLDHTNLLGDTLEKIGREKAGIIKPKVPVVISQYQSETAPVFLSVAKDQKSPITFADKNYKVLSHRHEKGYLQAEVLNKKTGLSSVYELDLQGSYQLKNLLGVLNTLEFVEQSGFFIDPLQVQKALKQVSALTGLRGRWQTLSTSPLTIADTGHNEDGIRHILEHLKQVRYRTLHIVFGAVNDKAVSGILALLPREAVYYFVRADIPRALDAQELQTQASSAGLRGQAYASVEAGWKAARKAAGKQDMILIGGSTFVVGEVLALSER